jgi:uncharacterized phage protein (TIGR01671 family)
MRPIKFRAWDVTKKVMTAVAGVWLGDDGSALTITFEPAPKTKWHVGLVHGESGILMQSTGIKDKNGKEIFEGDILAPMPNDYKDEYKGSWKVVYHDGAYFGEDSDGHHITWLPYWTEEQFEVVGNIYENPELMS